MLRWVEQEKKFHNLEALAYNLFKYVYLNI